MRLTLLLFVLLASSAFAGPKRTHMIGALYHPIGVVPLRASVTVQLNVPIKVIDSNGVSSTTYTIGSVPQTITLTNPASVDFYLCPNVGSTPAGTYYNVTARTQLGDFTQMWQIPDTAVDTRISDVTIDEAPAAANTYVLRTGDTVSGTLTLNGSPAINWGVLAVPSAPVTGSSYFDSTLLRLRTYSGVAEGWVTYASGGAIPSPSGAGKTIYDNGTNYVALAAGTVNQVYRGGSAPSWGAVPLAAIQEVLAIADLSDVTALGGAAQDLGASASNGSGTVVAFSNHVHKGLIGQDEGVNQDSGNGNKTINVTGAGATLSVASGVITINVPGTGIATITVEEGDSTVDAATTVIDFNADDFDGASSPAGEVNLSASTTLKTYSAVPGLTHGLAVTTAGGNQATITADVVIVSNGTLHKAISAVNVTPDCSVAGSAANGRDQAAAFSSSSWIYGWVIWDGTTIAGLWSHSATAPTLPTGYTHKALVTAAYTGGGSNIALGYKQQGRFAAYEDGINNFDVSAGAATSLTAVSLTDKAPPQSRLVMVASGIIPNAADNYVELSGNSLGAVVRTFGPVAGRVSGYNIVTMPCTSGQEIYYKNSAASCQAYVACLGWWW